LLANPTPSSGALPIIQASMDLIGWCVFQQPGQRLGQIADLQEWHG
jgi:hypothetical protein